MSQAIWIEAAPLTNIEFGATGERAVYQNVRVILTTIAGTVMLDRDFGVSGDIIDMPLLAAKQRLLAEIVEKIAYYEPRVRVYRIQFADPGVAETESGTLVPRVLVRIREGVLT